MRYTDTDIHANQTKPNQYMPCHLHRNNLATHQRVGRGNLAGVGRMQWSQQRRRTPRQMGRTALVNYGGGGAVRQRRLGGLKTEGLLQRRRTGRRGGGREGEVEAGLRGLEGGWNLSRLLQRIAALRRGPGGMMGRHLGIVVVVVAIVVGMPTPRPPSRPC